MMRPPGVVEVFSVSVFGCELHECNQLGYLEKIIDQYILLCKIYPNNKVLPKLQELYLYVIEVILEYQKCGNLSNLFSKFLIPRL